MKTCLVTGGAGFIGSNFILYMRERYPDLRIINLDKLTYAGNLGNLKSLDKDPHYVFVKGDVCDQDKVRELFREYDIEKVYHFAAESHVDRSIRDPGLFATTNIMGTLNLLDAAKDAWSDSNGAYRSGVKFLHVSTDEVYGALGETGFFTESSPISPRSPYAASKASAQHFVWAYYETYGLPVNVTCCSNNYGPFQFPEKLIPLMINNALDGRPLPIYGEGLQVRDWLYVDDHCKAIEIVAENGNPGKLYNVGGHNEMRNIDIVRTIIAELAEQAGLKNGEKLISFVDDRKGHDWRYAIDPSKIGTELSWKPETPFAAGIKKTVRWYLDNRKWLDGVTSGAYREYYENMYKQGQ